MEVGDEIAGTYTITTAGLITITFNEDFANGDPFAGNISFHGEVSLADIEEGDGIVFGGAGGTITIVPDAGDTSLHIEKTGYYNQAEGKMYYTVTVSSEDGSDGTIHYTDKFLNLTGGIAYEEESIRVLDSAGQEVEVEIDFHTGSTWFEILNLPQLGPGEFYTISYTATVDPDDTTTEDGSLEARNQASAADESNQVSTIHEVEISGPRIQKIGVYNPSTREVVWTVYLYNPRGYDLAGKTLRDTMTWTYGEKTLTQNIESATLTPYTGGTPGESEPIELPYTFPANSTQSYILTYTTSLPEDAAVGADLSVTNTAWLDNWKAVYIIDGTVPGKTGLVKTFTGQGDGDAVESDLNWSSIITFPQGTLEADTLDSIRYVDIIQDAVNEGWQLRAGTHYTTPELLEQLVAAPVEGYNQQAPLEYETDYTIQVVTAADFQTTLGETYYNATGVGYVFKTVAFDQLFGGFTFDDKTYQFNWQDLKKVADGTPIAMFAVTFTSSALDELNAAGQISISYSTHYDLSKVTGNGTYTLVNGGRTPSNSAAANTETALLAQLNKQVSTIGGHDYTLESDAYTDGPAKMDVGDTDGNIYYRILLYNFGDEISLQDTMWSKAEGWQGSVVFDSIQVYNPFTNEVLYSLKPWDYLSKEQEYYGSYKLSRLGDYKGYIIGLYYHIDVNVNNNLPQGETKTFTNTVEWIGVDDDSATAQVTNSGATLEKTGEALEDGLVRYYVTINPSGRDLLENGSTLTLTDTLTLSANSAAATFLPETAKLYRYDAAAENNLGEDISERLSLTYEEETHTITFTLPDQVACVVVYEYEITRGAAAGNIDVSNTAQLTGVATTGSGSELVLTDQSSGATVNSATLRIYKHEAGSINALLSQAHFTLERYEKDADGAYEWTPSTLTALGEDGSFIVEETGYIELNFLAHAGTGSLYNTLYRLQETQAPEGYAAEEGYRYFVWMEQGKDEAGTYAAMQEAGAWPEGVDEGEVTFIAYSTNGAIYVSNEPLTTSITVEKQWQGAEGTELGDEEHPAEVEVTLYQVSENGGKTKYEADGIVNPVTLTADTNWTYTWEQLPKEVDGQAVTYTVVETPITGWEASYDYGEGATGITEGTIQIINTKQSAFTLPETGGVGPTLVAIAGVPLVGAAGVVYWNLRRKRRRGGKGP